MSLLVTFLAVAVSTSAKGAPTPPPTESGIINGQSAIMLWPDDGKPLAGCEAHVMPLDHQDVEYRYGCGEWFIPPALGQYKTWAEREETITPLQANFTYQGGRSPRGGAILRVPMGPAGELALSSPRGKEVSLHAANLDTYLAGAPNVSREFDRRVKADRVQNVKMPAGRILAGLFDIRTNDAIAIAKPMTLQERRVLYVNPQPPAKGADVFTVLQRSRLRSNLKDDSVQVKLDYRGGSRAPDVVADDAGVIVAAWYAVPTGGAKLSADSDRFHFSREIILREGRVTTVRGAIEALPSVRVSVKSAMERLPDMRIAVLDKANRTIREAPVHERRATAEGVPTTATRVRLVATEFSLEQPVDLTSGADAEVTFTLTPFTVQGTLFRGEERVTGEIEFLAQGKTRQVSASEDGRYSVVLWNPAYYVLRLKLPDTPQTIFGVHLFDHDDVFDVRVPGTRCAATVRSKATGRPAPDTQLVIMNKYVLDTGQEVNDRQEAITDASGVAKLPPLHPGNVEITVWAHKEFRQFQRTFVVSGTAEEQTFPVVLDSSDDQRKVTVRWPDGTPAPGADLLLWNPANPLAVVWRGTSDAAGEADVPASVGAFLIARHLRGSAITRVPQNNESAEVLLTPAIAPLSVKCIRIAKSAQPIEIALWVNGVQLTGAAVAFMSGAGYITNGTWSANGLPAADLRILAFHPRLESAVFAGQYDALATRFDVSQSDTLSIRVVE